MILKLFMNTDIQVVKLLGYFQFLVITIGLSLGTLRDFGSYDTHSELSLT